MCPSIVYVIEKLQNGREIRVLANIHFDRVVVKERFYCQQVWTSGKCHCVLYMVRSWFYFSTTAPRESFSFIKRLFINYGVYQIADYPRADYSRRCIHTKRRAT